MSAWANRKAAVQAEADADAKSVQDAVIADHHAVLAEKPEEEVLAELELPNPDEMQAGDDFSAFMKSTVPTALRNRALRKLWTSDPVLANVDMLVDYGEDFTGKNDALTVVKTIYRVGKGLLPDKEELAEGDAQNTNDGVQVADKELEALDTNTGAPTEQNAPKVEDAKSRDAAPLPLVAEDAPTAVVPRRRMRFDFEPGSGPVTAETEMT